MKSFERTVCACNKCRVGCKTMPGTLAPGDAQKIARYMDREPTAEWAEQHLQASDGIKLVRFVPGGIEITQVPTLVPRLTEEGCVFLTQSGYCSIHEVAPAGCSYFDTHQSEEEGHERSLALALAARDERDDVYDRIAEHLTKGGFLAPPLSERRERYRDSFVDK